MNEIEHEGKTYILKSQVESIIKERVSKVAQRASEYEAQLESMNKDLERAKKSSASVDILKGRIDELQNKYDKANQRYDRYTAISGYGLTDPDLVEAIEWAYDRAMSKQDKPVELKDWLKGAFEDPSSAPVMLRPHIEAARTSMNLEAEVEGNPNIERQQLAELGDQIPENSPIAPRTNLGAVSLPDKQTSLSNRVYDDPELYEANRELLMKNWYNQNRSRRR